MKNYLVFSAVLAFLQSATGQPSWKSLHVSGSRSVILRHSPKFDRIEDLQPGYSIIAGMYFKPTSGRVFTGINATWYHSGSKVTGNGLAAQGNLNFPVAGRQKFAAFASVGLGGVFMKKHHHPDKNPSNLVIGSSFNAFVNALFVGEYRMSGKLALTAHSGLAHISNGAFKLPNIGINTFQSGLGLRCAPAGWMRQQELPGEKTISVKANQAEKQPKFFSSLRTGAGVFQHKEFSGEYFTILNAGIFGHTRLLPNFSISAGLSAESTDYLSSLRTRYPETVKKPGCRVAAESGLEWIYERIFLKGAAGYYLFKPDLAFSKNQLYFRLAAHYCFKNTGQSVKGTPFLGVGLKAYKNIAQHPEITGGYLF